MPPVLGLLLGVLIGLALLALLGLVLRWLWNTTLPEIAGLRPITTLQAVKLIFISAILFGGHRIVTIEPTVTRVPGGEVERIAVEAFLSGVPSP